MSDDWEHREPIWGVDAPGPVPCRRDGCANEFIGFWGEFCSADCDSAARTPSNMRQENPDV